VTAFVDTAGADAPASGIWTRATATSVEPVAAATAALLGTYHQIPVEEFPDHPLDTCSSAR
jgi:hypothetical protein